MTTRGREEGDEGPEPSSKRTKVVDVVTESNEESPIVVDGDAKPENPLPPSHVLLGIPPATSDGFMLRINESDVGISEYVGRNAPKIDGIIKQRFTDFLVHEVDLDSRVVHIKSLAMPESGKKDKVLETSEPIAVVDEVRSNEEQPGSISTNVVGVVMDTANEQNISNAIPSGIGEVKEESATHEPWPERFDTVLKPFLSADTINRVKEMFLEGPEPPRVSDRGWEKRPDKSVDETRDVADAQAAQGEIQPPTGHEQTSKRDRNNGRRGRGGRGGQKRGGGIEDERKVLSDPISSKATRTALHDAIRELFRGKLDSQTENSASVSSLGSRIVIKWTRQGGGGRGGRFDRAGQGEGTSRGSYPPYIHFTLQKTNRDTQDALAHLSRSLHVNVKDLSVAGTKDKRGVTVQRVSLKRGNKTVQDVWKFANGQSGRKSPEDALKHRGERGVRIADLNYRKSGLELGMLKGNAFLITLRNVQVDSTETLDLALNTIKQKGFINYYGMQRFGTASVPTHSIGLALLKSDWHKAVSLILQTRPGEHPDVAAARVAWLVDRDLDKALELMPRRVVAERCILESYKKQGGETRNAMGALSTIPRNLRMMYVHAYQSYVWNAIVSERIRTYGSDSPVAGDLVFEADSKDTVGEMDMDVDLDESVVTAEKGPEEDTSTRPGRKSRKPWVAPRVKTLTQEDVDKYTIFDVIMPLPGKDVAFPGGKLGEKYKEFLRLDGLDPDNFVRKQKEYSLSGSYRTILHLPRELSWCTLRYTDPDVPLAQSDEDKLLGFDAPAVVEDGKFTALQINMTLGTAAYATMALREITKTDTSSHFQSDLTQASEDQKFRAALRE